MDRKKTPRWERRKETRPSELTAAALELFVEKGFAATKLDDIATRAGVSKGTLYLYFDSKEALFKAVVREGLVPALVEGEQLVSRHAGSAEQLLRELIYGWWEVVGARRIGGIPKLIIAEARNFPEIASFYHKEVILRGTALMKRVLQQGVASGEFRPFDPDVMVHIVFAPLLMRAVFRHSMECCGVATVPMDNYLDEYFELMVRGLRADSSRRKEKR